MPKINFISIGSYFKEIGDEIKNKNLDTFLSFCMTSKIQAQKVIDFQLQKVNENADCILSSVTDFGKIY